MRGDKLMNSRDISFFKAGLWLILALCWLLPADLPAQQREGPWRKAADKAFANSDFYSATKYYQILTEFDSLNTYYWLRLGQSAREVNDYKLAEVAYAHALDLDSGNSNYPNTAYYLAEIKHRLGKYSEAGPLYRRFLDRQPNAPEQLRYYAEVGAESCEWAPPLVADADSWPMKLAGDSLNTPFSEFGGFIRNDTLWYASYRFDYKQDEAVPKRKYFKVMQAVGEREGQVYWPLDTTGRHTGNPTLSRDGSQIYYTICNYVGVSSQVRCDIYRRKRLNGAGWSAPERLAINAPDATNTEPCLGWDDSAKREVLLFASDRSGGMGQLDLWYSYLDEQGGLSEPVNLRGVNSPGREMSPYFHEPSQRLFFSTDGQLTFGGMDVYSAFWPTALNATEEGGAAAIQNLGYPLNSSYDDLYFFLAPETNTLLVSSNREGSTPYAPPEPELETPPDSLICCYDLWKGRVKVDLEARTYFAGTYYKEKGVPADTVFLYGLAPDGTQTLLAKSHQAEDMNLYELGQLQLFRRYMVVGFKRGFPRDTVVIDDLMTFEKMPKRDTTLQVDLKFLEFFDLQILTFRDFEGVRSPLNECTVRLSPLGGDSSEKVQIERNATGNDFLFQAKINQTYLLTTSREGYWPRRDSLLITAEDILRIGQRISPTLTRVVAEVELELYPDAKMFFANNQPSYPREQRNREPRLTFAEDWPETYFTTYEAYIDQEDEIYKRYMRGAPAAKRATDSSRFVRFFDDFVERGWRQLDSVVCPLALEALQNGDTVTLEIIGRTSPLGSEAYNLALSKRRISSIVNHFKTYQDGAFLPYLHVYQNGLSEAPGNGQFVIESNPRGKKDAPSGVSDSARNRRASVDDPIASAERHVEVRIKNITMRDQKIIFQ